jgi:hypothetical protein
VTLTYSHFERRPCENFGDTKAPSSGEFWGGKLMKEKSNIYATMSNNEWGFRDASTLLKMNQLIRDA